MPSWMQADKLTAEQKANVKTIIDVGRHLGASDRDITIALMAAAQESEFRNIDYGDKAGPDSRGLFQQRDAWGTLAQRMDPAQATVMFFTGGHDGQRGLFDFRNRDALSLTRAAQAVQVSAYPDAYAKHQQLAEDLLNTTAGPAATTPGLQPPGRGSSITVPTTTTAPPVDLSTPQTDLAALQAKRQAPLSGPVGLGAATAPGLGAASAPGIGISSGPGSARVAPPTAASLGPPAPATALTRAQFDSTFPDAAGTKMFSQAGNALGARRSDVVSSAASYIGVPYVWGGEDRSGLDCSGLVQQVYKGFGIDLPRLSADQARAGTSVSFDQLKPGDLVAWDNSPRNRGVDHISIYAGDGFVIEAPRPGLNVRKRRLSASEIKAAEGVHFAQFD